MGVYKRKKKYGKLRLFWIVKFPHGRDPLTGRILYTTLVAGPYKREAEAIFQKKMVEWRRKVHLGIEQKKDLTVSELVDWYLALPRTLQVRSAYKIIQHCRRLKRHFGDLKISELKPYMVEEYQRKRLSEISNRGTNYKPASINREIEVLKRMCNLAVREDLLEKNPCFKVTRLPENNARNRTLSLEELDRLVQLLPRHAADLVIVGYFTGMRFGEIVGLTWDRVNLRDGCLYLTPMDTKTNEPRDFYFNGILREVFERVSKIKATGQSFVFTYRGKPIRSIKIALASGLKKAKIENFRFHDLRHTFNTNMRKAGVERTVIMKLTGHKTDSMFRRYNTVDALDAREAMRRLDALLESERVATASILLQPQKRGQEESPNPLN
jgi:integrase